MAAQCLQMSSLPIHSYAQGCNKLSKRDSRKLLSEACDAGGLFRQRGGSFCGRGLRRGPFPGKFVKRQCSVQAEVLKERVDLPAPLMRSDVPEFVREAVREQPWKGGLEPSGEVCYTVDPRQVEGAIPEELRGTLYRCGPNRIRWGGKKFGHWFDGDGMVFALTLDGPNGEVRFRSRYTETERLKAQKKAGPEQYAGKAVWTTADGGPLANFGSISNPYNTSVLHYGGKLYALAEGGPPLEIDPETLESKKVDKFGGGLPGFFSAHPKVCPLTGELFNHGIGADYMRIFALDIYSLTPSGKVHKKNRVDLDLPTFIHDNALTENYFMTVIPPYYTERSNLILNILGFNTVGNTFKWMPEKGTRLVILSRKNLSVAADIVLKPPDVFSTFHFANAFEENGKLHVYINRLNGSRDTLERAFRDMYASHWTWDCLHSLFEYIIDVPSATVTSQEPLMRPPPGSTPPFGMEYPRMNESYQGRRNRYLYVAGNSKEGTLKGPKQGQGDAVYAGVEGRAVAGPRGMSFLDCLQKYDIETGRVQTKLLGEGQFPSEVVVVPKGGEGEGKEDDVYLVSFVYDSRRHGTDVVVLDAAKFEEKPVCVIHLPTHVSYTFHGCWVPAGAG